MIIETFDIKEEKLLERMNAGILGNKIYKKILINESIFIY